MLVTRTIALLLLVTLLGGTQAFADQIALREDHPNRYVVVKGDTLWDISARFLRDPWLWPEVWTFNPQIKNPHLIYPGDVVSLVYDDQGNPSLRVDRGQPTVKLTPDSSGNTVRLAPQIRATRIDQPISSIPLGSIQQFLGHPEVISEHDINNAAHIVSTQDQHLIVGKDETIYVRGLVQGGDTEYTVIRIGDAYRNPGASKSDILGYEAIHVAEAKVVEFGEPSTLLLTKSSREVIVGDRLLPKRDYGLDTTFIPHPPEAPIEGQIIAVIDGLSRIGQFQTVVLNLGEQDGLETGHVMAIFQSGAKVRDPHDDDLVTLPDVRAGVLMVIRTFELVSYAMVMEVGRDVRLHDYVRNP